jgi:hypothetical protein
LPNKGKQNNRVYEPRHVHNDRVTSGNRRHTKTFSWKGVQTTSSSSNTARVSNQPTFERRLTADTPEYLIFNSNKSPTRCNNFPVYHPGVYLKLNMFRAFSRPSSGAK